MRVFVTGAAGFIGSAVVRELLDAGHQVLGLSRSDAGAAALAAAGAEPVRGDLADLDGLTAAAARSDGVIHLAFNHDFSRYVDNCEDDRRAIDALAAGLAGSQRPLIVTSGVAVSPLDRPAREDDRAAPSAQVPRAASEEAAAEAAARGVRASVMRLPQVHDTRRQGFVSYVVAAALRNGVSAYVGEGANRWPATHVSDVARLYRLALEAAPPGGVWHAVAEEGVPLRTIAEAIGARLRLPVRSIAPEAAAAHFGWIAPFVVRDMPASSARTRAALSWRPAGPGMIADLERLETAEA